MGAHLPVINCGETRKTQAPTLKREGNRELLSVSSSFTNRKFFCCPIQDVSLQTNLSYCRMVEIRSLVPLHAEPLHYPDGSSVFCCRKRHYFRHSQRLECHLKNGSAGFRYQTSSPKTRKKSPKYLYARSKVGFKFRYRKSDDSSELLVNLQSIYAEPPLREAFVDPFKCRVAFLDRPWMRKELHYPWISIHFRKGSQVSLYHPAQTAFGRKNFWWCD